MTIATGGCSLCGQAMACRTLAKSPGVFAFGASWALGTSRFPSHNPMSVPEGKDEKPSMGSHVWTPRNPRGFSTVSQIA